MTSSHSSKTEAARVVLTIVLSLSIFAIGFFLPPGISSGLLYVAVLLLAVTMHRRAVFWRIVGLVIVLRIASFLLKPQATSGEEVIALVNLALSLFAIWATAFLGAQWSATQERILAANESLDQRVRENTRELQVAIEDLQREVDQRQRAQADLEWQKMLLDGLMDAIPDNIYFKDPDGKYLRINRAKAQRSGLRSPEEGVGKTDFDFFQPEHAAEALAIERRIIQTGEPLIDHEEKLIWPDGRVSWASSTKVPLKRPDGRVIGTLGISRDITSHHEMSEALELQRDRLRTLIDHLPDYVFIKDSQGRFVTVNRALIQMYGCQTEDELIGKSDFDFSPPELAKIYAADDQQVIRQGRILFNREEELLSAGKEHRWVLTTKVPLRSPEGEIIGLVGIARDITKRKLAEQELEAAKEAAEVANRAKSEFLANMSHEIRTPMNAIIGMSELVLDTSLTPQQRDYLETVLSSAESLMGIINDILDFSKIESGRFELDRYPVEIREWLGDSIKPLAIRAHAKKLELACHIAPEVPRYVEGDGLRLRQVIVNLLGNAIKFTQIGEVVLDVKREADDDQHVTLHFRVSDTGIGIAPEQQHRVFEAFEQADMSTTRTYGGTGLGLAISSRLVQLMGGRIWVDSQLGEGSTFHFVVPFGRIPDDAAPPSRQESSDLNGLRILIVDDNETNRDILEEMCRNWRMLPRAVPGAKAAIQELRSAWERNETYDLVITDASMPEVDGFMLAEFIKQHEELGSTVVMMLSSVDRQFDLRRCEEIGIRSYLTKPIKQSDLFDAIAAALDLSVTPAENVSKATQKFPQLRPMQILLAEDSLANQKLALGLLTRWGHHVTVASNGREAVEAAQRQNFDIILMDVQMPDVDGLTATRQIRKMQADTGGPKTPIIAMTAHAMKGDRERCLEAGMENYVSKPVRPFDLASILAHYGTTVETPPDVAVESPLPQTAGAPEAVPSPATGPALSWKTLLEHVQQDEALAQEVVQAYLDESPRILTRLSAAIDQADSPAARIAAHTMKGNLRTLGAPAQTLAAELEAAILSGDWPRSRALLERFRPELASIETQLRQILSTSVRV